MGKQNGTVVQYLPVSLALDFQTVLTEATPWLEGGLGVSGVFPIETLFMLTAT